MCEGASKARLGVVRRGCSDPSWQLRGLCLHLSRVTQSSDSSLLRLVTVLVLLLILLFRSVVICFPHMPRLSMNPHFAAFWADHGDCTLRRCVQETVGNAALETHQERQRFAALHRHVQVAQPDFHSHDNENEKATGDFAMLHISYHLPSWFLNYSSRRATRIQRIPKTSRSFQDMALSPAYHSDYD
ncbi:hypothetical protein MRB53_040368 [Persea americana]|nr:hypothetical protein MRB53_040368 [Persea americana]